MASYAQDEDFSEFISPFLRHKCGREETVYVTPKEPSRNKKVYLVKKETGLTGRNFVQCSYCHHSSFKLYRSLTRASLPDHLKYLGNSESEILQFCRTCWDVLNLSSSNSEFANNNMKLDWLKTSHSSSTAGPEVRRPYFEKGPLGITDQRACFSWHFIQRDFVRKKISKGDRNERENSAMLPLVSVIGQDGSEFVNKDYNANRFDCNGKEISLHNESGYGSNGNSPSNDNEIDSVASILMNIHKDHDYAPAMQREIEVTTSARSPVKNAYQNNSSNGLHLNRKHAYKMNDRKEQVRKTANKLVKKAAMFEGHQRHSNNFVTVNLPVTKVEEQLRSKREKDGGPDPSYLMGLKATAEDGQTLPGLICPLCGKHTVKSYSVWKKENAPSKIEHLFKDGVTVIRACRKCVPYPLNREKKNVDKNGSSAIGSSQNLSKNTKVQQQVNGKRMGVNGCPVNDNNAKGGSLSSSSKGHMSKIEIQTSKVKRNDLVVLNVGVKVARVKVNVKNEKNEKIRTGKQQRNNEENEDEMVKKKAKIEEKKRKIEIANGGELTGLECFESLQSEEKIDGFDDLEVKVEDCLLCNEAHNNNGVTVNKVNLRGRAVEAMMCDKCSTSLGKTFRVVKQSKCPKRFMYFFKQNKNRRSMRVCKNCSKK